MNQIYTRIAIIVVGVLLVAALGLSIVTLYQHQESRHLQQIHVQEAATQHTIDSLIDDHRDRISRVQVFAMSVMTERDSLRAVISTRIDHIKISYDKKVDNVPLLPADSLLRLLSDQVSR